MFLLILFITLVLSHCPSNINSYNGDIEGIVVDLDNLPDQLHLEKFIPGNFSLPNPVLSSYFAYQTRELVKYLHCFNQEEGKITYTLDGIIKFSGNLKSKDSLLKLALIFDQITQHVLYSSRKVYVDSISQDELIDYNFECIENSDRLNSPQIRKISTCDRMIIYEQDLKSHAFDGFKRIIRSWIN